MDVFIFTVFSIKVSEANSVDPDQMSHSAVSELGLHCLNNTQNR